MNDSLPPVGDAMMAMSTLPALSAKMNPDATIEKTSQDFEAMFATQMLQPMFEGLGVNPTFGGGHGEEVMRSFLIQEYGKMIAKTGKLGIAPQVKSEMLRAQEGSRAKAGNLRMQAAQNAYQAANTQGGSYVSN